MATKCLTHLLCSIYLWSDTRVNLFDSAEIALGQLVLHFRKELFLKLDMTWTWWSALVKFEMVVQ